MNINDIERIVKLIETTTDPDLKKILKDYLAAEAARKYVYPSIPNTKWESVSRCSKCGLELTGTMGYCCPHNDCPTGMGPVIC